MGKGVKRIFVVLQAVRVVVGLAGLALLGLLGYHLYEYWQGEQLYEDVRQAVTAEEVQEETKEEADPGRAINFDALRALNPDCVAWIYGCDGAIDYPVVLSQDDSYYLTHTVSGEANRAGSIFVDMYANAPFAEFQTILYGHNMKNGSMFHALLNYREREYWEEHPNVTVYLEGETKKYQIFAAYYDYYEELPVYDSMETQEEREAYIGHIKGLSLYDTAVEVSADARLLTLITCEYSGEDYRMVVHGKEMEEEAVK